MEKLKKKKQQHKYDEPKKRKMISCFTVNRKVVVVIQVQSTRTLPAFRKKIINETRKKNGLTPKWTGFG